MGSVFHLSFPWDAFYFFLGQAWADGKGGLQRAAITQTVAGKRSKCTPP